MSCSNHWARNALLLGPHVFHFAGFQLAQGVFSGFGADRDPIESGGQWIGPVGFDRQEILLLFEGSDQPFIQLQAWFSAGENDGFGLWGNLKAYLQNLCRRQFAPGEEFRVAIKALSLATAIQIAARKADEDVGRAGAQSLALETVEDFVDGIGSD